MRFSKMQSICAMEPSNCLDKELHKHAAHGDVTKVKDAIQKGANVNSKDASGSGESALISAMCFGYLNSGVQNRSAASNAYLNVVCEFLKHDEVDVNIKDNSGVRSPLLGLQVR
jgi:hypothetical protein